MAGRIGTKNFVTGHACIHETSFGSLQTTKPPSVGGIPVAGESSWLRCSLCLLCPTRFPGRIQLPAKAMVSEQTGWYRSRRQRRAPIPVIQAEVIKAVIYTIRLLNDKRKLRQKCWALQIDVLCYGFI